MNEENIINNIENELRFLTKEGFSAGNADLWTSRAGPALQKFVDGGGNINIENLKNFRRHQIFINEFPNYEPTIFNYIPGHRRGQFAYLDDRLKIMKTEDDQVWLEKYPIDCVGNPIVYESEGFRFNKRWSNNIRYLKLAAQNLAPVLSRKNCSIVDIGGGYGIFLYLLKKEFPDCRLTLVEFPEQLLLAYYFLQTNFPDAKINSLEEAYSTSEIDRAFIDKFDFVLIPIDCYSKVVVNTIDLVSNFYSLGEMSNDWFDVYRHSAAFKTAPYFLTVNRVFSRPTYKTDIDILRYKLHKYKTIHFEPSRYERDYIQAQMKFFYRRAKYSSQCFEYIGGPIDE